VPFSKIEIYSGSQLIISYSGIIGGGDVYMCSVAYPTTLTINTDKLLYKVGENITITGTLSPSLPGRTITIKVMIKNTTVATYNAVTLADSSYKLVIKAPEVSLAEYVKIVASYAGEIVNSTTYLSSEAETGAAVAIASLPQPKINTTTTKDWSKYLVLILASGKGLAGTIADMLHIPVQLAALLLVLVIVGAIISIIMKTWKIIAIILALALLLAFMGLI